MPSPASDSQFTLRRSSGLGAIAPVLHLVSSTMIKTKQLNLFQNHAKNKKFFGGALLYKKRKSQRPLSRKEAIHLVLRSPWAMGQDSFLAKRNQFAIKQILGRFGKKFGVRIYQQAINSNHLHLLLRITNRQLYRAFIKAIAGQIASHVMGQQSFLLFSASRMKLNTNNRRIREGCAGDGSKVSATAIAGDGSWCTTPAESLTGFWEFRPFSRVVNWGRDFKICLAYVKQNVLEALGFVNYRPRKNYYSAWLKLVAPVFITG